MATDPNKYQQQRYQLQSYSDQLRTRSGRCQREWPWKIPGFAAQGASRMIFTTWTARNFHKMNSRSRDPTPHGHKSSRLISSSNMLPTNCLQGLPGIHVCWSLGLDVTLCPCPMAPSPSTPDGYGGHVSPWQSPAGSHGEEISNCFCCVFQSDDTPILSLDDSNNA